MTTFNPIVPKKLARARVDFKPEKFRRLIFTKGEQVRWEKAIDCPCRTILDLENRREATGEPAVDCPECRGYGILYYGSQIIPALVEDNRKNPERFALYGEYAKGSCNMTFLPETTPSFRDRITLIDPVVVLTETRIRKKTVEQPRYPIVKVTKRVGTELDPTEVALQENAVLHCRRASFAGNVVSTALIEGTDFTVTDDGKIDWSLGDILKTAPAVGDRFSLAYYANPVYIINEFPYSFRDTHLKQKFPTDVYRRMPTQVTCWLEFLGSPP